MTDIVDRIRDIAIHADLTQVQTDVLHEAADEIEHLRSVLNNLTKVMGAARIGPSFAEITKELPRRTEFVGYTKDGVPCYADEPPSVMQAGPYVGVFRGLNDT